MIRIRELVLERGGARLCELAALDVAAGARIGIEGPNGAGKTTLLRLLAGFETPTAGELSIAVAPRQRVFIHQQPYFFRGDVGENLGYGLRARGISRADARRRGGALLAELGLADALGRDPRSLSAGERRRVALARALLLEPALLLLDEPFAELDDAGRQLAVAALERGRRAWGMTALLASPRDLGADVDSQVRLAAPA